VNPLRAAILRGARSTGAGGSVPRGTRPGDGFAFDRLRGYAEGDDPRRIDWPATARAGALQTRVYLEETVLVLAAVVDESPSMQLGRRRPLRASAAEAVAAWFAAAETGDRTQRIVEGAPFDLRRSLELAARAVVAGSSLLLVTDGLALLHDDASPELLFRLGRRFDALVLLAADPWIDGLGLRGLVNVRDVRTGRTSRVHVGARGAERYVRASRARDENLRALFRRAGWRAGALDEAGGAASLDRAFGLR
jgi:uncharacterized protein (DUF58 family)